VGWGGGGGGMKPVGPKKMISSESIWSSKQYRVLVEMGCRKEDAEFALRSTNGNLEDALELLNMNGRMREPGNMFGQECLTSSAVSPCQDLQFRYILVEPISKLCAQTSREY
jgi:hypothetical protein